MYCSEVLFSHEGEQRSLHCTLNLPLHCESTRSLALIVISLFFLYLQSLVESFWKKATRPDGRLFSQTRRTVVQRQVLTQHAAGSALVKLGDSQVIAGVSYAVGQPVGVNQGDVLVTISDSRNSGSGGNNMNSSLQLYLNRLLEETLDLEQLSIVPEQAAFRLFITVQILNHDGNIRDACLLACVAALTDTKLPTNTIWQDGKVWLRDGDVAEGDKEDAKSSNEKEDDSGSESFRQLQIPVVPVPLTMGVWHDVESDKTHLIVDPSEEEDSALTSRMTVVVNAMDPVQILLLDLSGRHAVSKTELALATRMAAGRAEELRDVLLHSSD
jgi:exosome complex RNA-binding protein Rrp42 (RNase PH superfamily)